MWKLFSVIISLLYGIVHCQDIIGEVTRGLPCIKRLNQLYCHRGGAEYPQSAISTYIDDNKALMRRMYGTLNDDLPLVPDLPEEPKTPASTSLFVRSVRNLNFGGPRFKRSASEGVIEDFLEESQQDFEPLDWTILMKNLTLFKEFSANATQEDMETFWALKEAANLSLDRPKRQSSGFPGAANKPDNKIDACESRVEVTTPYWATNSNGKVRAIVNDKHFEQSIHQEICISTRTFRCSGDCACEQKYKWHRLLAYDPNNDCSGVFMDWFLFPSCCSCRCLKNPFA